MDSSERRYHEFLVKVSTYLRSSAFATSYELNLIHYLNLLAIKYTLPGNMTTAKRSEALSENPGGMLKKTKMPSIGHNKIQGLQSIQYAPRDSQWVCHLNKKTTEALQGKHWGWTPACSNHWHNWRTHHPNPRPTGCPPTVLTMSNMGVPKGVWITTFTSL